MRSTTRGSKNVPVVIGIAGRIGSGKSTLAKHLSEELGCVQSAFSSVLRAIATERGLDVKSREVLQSIALDLIAQGWNSFCQRVLEAVRWKGRESLVIDGIRHVAAANALQRLVSPVRFILIWLEIDDLTLRARLQAKGIPDLATLVRLETHPAEGDSWEGLRKSANLVLDGGRQPRDLARQVVGWLRDSE